MRDYDTKYEAGDMILSEDIGYGLVVGHEDNEFYGPQYLIYWLNGIGLTKPSVENIDCEERCSSVWRNKTKLVEL